MEHIHIKVYVGIKPIWKNTTSILWLPQLYYKILKKRKYKIFEFLSQIFQQSPYTQQQKFAYKVFPQVVNYT